MTQLILKRISMGILFILMSGIIIYGALQSDFAQHYKKSDADVYKMKSKAAKNIGSLQCLLISCKSRFSSENFGEIFLINSASPNNSSNCFDES